MNRVTIKTDEKTFGLIACAELEEVTVPRTDESIKALTESMDKLECYPHVIVLHWIRDYVIYEMVVQHVETKIDDPEEYKLVLGNIISIDDKYLEYIHPALTSDTMSNSDKSDLLYTRIKGIYGILTDRENDEKLHLWSVNNGEKEYSIFFYLGDMNYHIQDKKDILFSSPDKELIVSKLQKLITI